MNDSREPWKPATLFKYFSTLNHWTFTYWLRMRLPYFRRSFFCHRNDINDKSCAFTQFHPRWFTLKWNSFPLSSINATWMQNDVIFDKFSLITFVVTFSWNTFLDFILDDYFYVFSRFSTIINPPPRFGATILEDEKTSLFDEPSRRSLTWKHKNVGSVFRWLLLTAILFWVFTLADSNKNQKKSFRVFLAFFVQFVAYIIWWKSISIEIWYKKWRKEEDCVR